MCPNTTQRRSIAGSWYIVAVLFACMGPAKQPLPLVQPTSSTMLTIRTTFFSQAVASVGLTLECGPNTGVPLFYKRTGGQFLCSQGCSSSAKDVVHMTESFGLPWALPASMSPASGCTAGFHDRSRLTCVVSPSLKIHSKYP